MTMFSWIDRLAAGLPPFVLTTAAATHTVCVRECECRVCVCVQRGHGLRGQSSRTPLPHTPRRGEQSGPAGFFAEL